MLPNQPCSFFWIADAIVIDGLIRSDNRGSESFFPLYLYERSSDDPPPGQRLRDVNLHPHFVRAVERELKLRVLHNESCCSSDTCGPRDLLGYIYAVFHSPTYRLRYAAWLQLDFPRIPLPRSLALFRQLADLGNRLIESHRASPDNLPGAASSQGGDSPRLMVPSPEAWPDDRLSLAAKYPRFAKRCLHLNEHVWVEGVTPEVWDFRVGGHQVCRKWLRDRRARGLSRHDLQYFTSFVQCLTDSLNQMKAIDQAVSDHGGWPAAFAPSLI
jgi:predicted helicase